MEIGNKRYIFFNEDTAHFKKGALVKVSCDIKVDVGDVCFYANGSGRLVDCVCEDDGRVYYGVFEK